MRHHAPSWEHQRELTHLSPLRPSLPLLALCNTRALRNQRRRIESPEFLSWAPPPRKHRVSKPEAMPNTETKEPRRLNRARRAAPRRSQCACLGLRRLGSDPQAVPRPRPAALREDIMHPQAVICLRHTGLGTRLPGTRQPPPGAGRPSAPQVEIRLILRPVSQQDRFWRASKEILLLGCQPPCDDR